MLDRIFRQILRDKIVQLRLIFQHRLDRVQQLYILSCRQLNRYGCCWWGKGKQLIKRCRTHLLIQWRRNSCVEVILDVQEKNKNLEKRKKRDDDDNKWQHATRTCTIRKCKAKKNEERRGHLFSYSCFLSPSVCLHVCTIFYYCI